MTTTEFTKQVAIAFAVWGVYDSEMYKTWSEAFDNFIESDRFLNIPQPEPTNNAEILQNGYEQGLKHKDKEWRDKVQKRIDSYNAGIVKTGPGSETWKRYIAVRDELTKLLEEPK